MYLNFLLNNYFRIVMSCPQREWGFTIFILKFSWLGSRWNWHSRSEHNHQFYKNLCTTIILQYWHSYICISCTAKRCGFIRNQNKPCITSQLYEGERKQRERWRRWQRETDRERGHLSGFQNWSSQQGCLWSVRWMQQDGMENTWSKRESP